MLRNRIGGSSHSSPAVLSSFDRVSVWSGSLIDFFDIDYWALFWFTEASPCFHTRFIGALMGFMGFSWVFIQFYRVLLGCLSLYLALWLVFPCSLLMVTGLILVYQGLAVFKDSFLLSLYYLLQIDWVVRRSWNSRFRRTYWESFLLKIHFRQKKNTIKPMRTDWDGGSSIILPGIFFFFFFFFFVATSIGPLGRRHDLHSPWRGSSMNSSRKKKQNTHGTDSRRIGIWFARPVLEQSYCSPFVFDRKRKKGWGSEMLELARDSDPVALLFCSFFTDGRRRNRRRPTNETESKTKRWGAAAPKNGAGTCSWWRSIDSSKPRGRGSSWSIAWSAPHHAVLNVGCSTRYVTAIKYDAANGHWIPVPPYYLFFFFHILLWLWLLLSISWQFSFSVLLLLLLLLVKKDAVRQRRRFMATATVNQNEDNQDRDYFIWL